VGVGELLGSVGDKVDVGTAFEDEAGGLDGVAKALDTGDSAGLHTAAVHEESVHLNASVGGKEAATASIEGGVIFKDGDGGLDGVEGRSAARENGVAGFEGVADTVQVVGFSFGGDGPSAAMNKKCRGVFVWVCH
jgi:hypothetical protein